jgi:hypothetical protein
VYVLLGISPASNCSWPTFRNTIITHITYLPFVKTPHNFMGYLSKLIQIQCFTTKQIFLLLLLSLSNTNSTFHSQDTYISPEVFYKASRQSTTIPPLTHTQCVPLATEPGDWRTATPCRNNEAQYRLIPLHFSHNERTPVQISLQYLHWC